MNFEQQPIIIIPARMASTRLPGKPLADINGLPMILHVAKRALEAGIGRVVIAAAEKEIALCAKNAGFEAVLTNPDHPSGTDRIYEALLKIDNAGKHDVIINLQGDLPTIDPKIIREILTPLKDKSADIATLVAKISKEGEVENPNVVKAVVSFNNNNNERIAPALYFSRSKVPFGEGPHFHHIGIYAYKRKALEKFVELPPSALERREKLEQLRALENAMTIYAVLVDTVPLGVDTLEDLEIARRLLRIRK